MSALTEPVTVAELLAELERMGADPATATIRIGKDPIYRHEYEVRREQGAAVIYIPTIEDNDGESA